MKHQKFYETIIANSGKIIEFDNAEIKIVESGISRSGVPYVQLQPPNKKLRHKMCAEREKHGNFTVRLGKPNRIILGKSSYPIRG